MSAYLGIDIAKAKFDVALIFLKDGKEKVQHKVCTNNPKGFNEFWSWLENRGVTDVHACMEATGRYWEDLATYLHEAGGKVSVVNPSCIKAFAQSSLSRNKTDKADAQLIARFCKAHEPNAWNPPPKEVKDLQALVRRRDVLLEMRQEEANRLESGVSEPRVRESIVKLIAHLDLEIKQIQEEIDSHINRHPGLKEKRDLLVSIPGIGKVTAQLLLGEIGDPEGFTSARQLAAYAGLTPRQHQSGSSVHGKSHLLKIGNAKLRSALFMPAIVAKRSNPIIKVFCERLLERGKSKMLVIGAAMRKLLHLVYGVLATGKPFDPKYAIA